MHPSTMQHQNTLMVCLLPAVGVGVVEGQRANSVDKSQKSLTVIVRTTRHGLVCRSGTCTGLMTDSCQVTAQTSGVCNHVSLLVPL